MKKQLLSQKKLTTLFCSLCLLMFCVSIGWGQTVVPFTTAGSTPWTCPTGVTSVQVEAWGGGGGGAGSQGSANLYSGGGGAGGNYSKATISVTPSTSYNVVVGAGGTGGAISSTLGFGGDGGTSSFGSVLFASGGSGAGGGMASNKAGIGGVNGGVRSYTLSNAGTGYSSAPTVTIGTAWSSGQAYTLNQQYFVAGSPNRLYTVTTAGNSGTTTPVHTTGAVACSGGSGPFAVLTYAGVAATATASLSGSVVQYISVGSSANTYTGTAGGIGSGYISVPTVTLTGGGFTTTAVATANTNILNVTGASTSYLGGNGGNGSTYTATLTTNASGGGGSSAGTSSNGNAASGTIAGASVTGGGAGAAGNPTGNATLGTVGTAAVALGGGGGGATGISQVGGVGFRGQVVITYTVAAPIVTTTAISNNTTGTTASSGGTLSSQGNQTVTAVGVCWSTSINPTTADPKTSDTVPAEGASFSSSITGLSQGTLYYIRAYATNATGTSYGANVSFTTIVSVVPVLTVGAISAGFGGQIINTTAGPNSFTISGTLLTTADVTVGALSGYSYSTTAGGTYTSSLSLPQSGGTFSQQIFVKFTPTLVQSYNGNIIVGGGGAASTVNCAVTGSGLPAEPTIAASALSFSNFVGTGFTINWTAGNGTNSIVVIKSATAVDSNPVDFNSYTANTVFGSGSQIGTGNYVVYNGTGNSVIVTGLTKGTKYYVNVYTFNGSGGAENYLTSSFVSGNQVAINTISSNGTGGGAWSATATWAGSVVPGQFDNVTVLSSDVIDVTAVARCNNLTINSGGKVWAPAGKTLQIYGTSLACDGTFGDVSNALTTGSQLTVEFGGNLVISGSGSFYAWKLRPVTALSNIGVTFNGSTQEITTASGTAVASDNTSNDNITYTISKGKTLKVYANWSMASSTNTNGTANTTINVQGTCIINGAFATPVASGKTCTVNVDGTLTGGTSYSPFSYTSGGTTTFNINGTFSVQNFNVTPTTAFVAPVINVGSTGVITVNGVADFSNTSLSGYIGNTPTTSGGTFTLASLGTIKLANALGLEPVSGPIRTTTRNFSTGANYHYVGTAAQVPGSNFPATVNNLIVNNAAGVTLGGSTTVNGILTLTAGTLTTGANTLTLAGTPSVVTGNINASNANATVTFANSTAVVLPASPLFTGNVQNLTINGVGGVTLGSATTISGILTLTAGTLTTGANTLTLGGALSVGAGSIDASNANATVTFANSTAIVLPASVFTGNVQNFTINGVGGVTLGSATTISGILTLTAGTLTTGANTLTLGGTPSVGTGNINASNANATVTFTNSTAVLLPASPLFTGNVQNLTINGVGGVTLGSATSLAGKLTLSLGTLSTGGLLTLKSGDCCISATVAPVTGGNVTGDVIVERYIPAGKRAYRLLSPATTGGTINSNWQEGGLVTTVGAISNPVPAYGTHISGAGGSANGFDTTARNSASIFTYDSTTPAWTALTSTSGTLTAGSPYLIYIRGSRIVSNIDGSSLTNDVTTLRTTGALTIGTVPVSGLNATAGEFSVVGNPYQAQVNMGTVLGAATNLNTGFYYILEPKMGISGAYVTIDAATGSNNSAGGSTANQYLQPGQACFVQTTANGAASLSFLETNKFEGTQTSVFRTAKTICRLSLALYDTAKLAQNGYPLDGLVVNFDGSESNKVNQNDATKLTNFNENMATSNNSKLLSIESRAIPTDTDEIPLNITKYRGTSYTIKAEGIGLTGSIPYLLDQYANKAIEIPQDGSVNYAYTVDAKIPASIAADRFKLIYAKTLKIIDNAKTRFALYPNPSKTNSFSVAIPQSIGKVSLTVSNMLGQQLHSQNDLQSGTTVKVTANNVKTAGAYLVRLTADGKTTTTKWIVE